MGKFIDVDVDRASFGEVSIKAIYELYRKHSKCSQAEFAKTPLRTMVNYLRKLNKLE